MEHRAGLITQPRRQVSYKLEINGILICTYIADFTYWRIGNLTEVIEDAKGVKTPEYKIKKKLMKAIHGVEIFET